MTLWPVCKVLSWIERPKICCKNKSRSSVDRPVNPRCGNLKQSLRTPRIVANNKPGGRSPSSRSSFASTRPERVQTRKKIALRSANASSELRLLGKGYFLHSLKLGPWKASTDLRISLWKSWQRLCDPPTTELINQRFGGFSPKCEILYFVQIIQVF